MVDYTFWLLQFVVRANYIYTKIKTLDSACPKAVATRDKLLPTRATC